MTCVQTLTVSARRRRPAARPLVPGAFPARHPGPHREDVPQRRDPGRRRPCEGRDPDRGRAGDPHPSASRGGGAPRKARPRPVRDGRRDDPARRPLEGRPHHRDQQAAGPAEPGRQRAGRPPRRRAGRGAEVRPLRKALARPPARQGHLGRPPPRPLRPHRAEAVGGVPARARRARSTGPPSRACRTRARAPSASGS